MKVVTIEQMQAIERAADSQGLSYAAMTENAGRSVATWMERKGVAGQRVLVLIGAGSGGGKGLVAARCLHEAGASVTLYCQKREVRDQEHWDLLQSTDVPVVWEGEDKRHARLRRVVGQADWIVDALSGPVGAEPIAGALGEILGVVAKGIAKRRGKRTPDPFIRFPPTASERPTDVGPVVVAVNAPAGLNCDTGAVDPVTLPADVTVTFGFPKVGHFLFPAAAHVGELAVANIGIPAKLSRKIDLEVSTPADVRALLPKRPFNAHKGTFGKVMVVAGSANYTGAAYLAASAAMRTGAGLVTLGIAEMLHSILAGKLSEATFLLLAHEMGTLVPEAVKVLRERLGDYDALLLGPGIGHDEKTAEFVAHLLGLPLPEKRARIGFLGSTAKDGKDARSWLPPLVIDADGLNALCRIGGWAESLHSPTVMTPHPGEMARLLGTSIKDVQADRIGIARRAAQDWKTVVVLKGAYSVIASPAGRACINPFACPALATAGTGDVLAGAIVGLLAQGLSPFDAAVVGTYLHGLAGKVVSEEIGPAGAVAGDLLARLPLSLRRVAGA